MIRNYIYNSSTPLRLIDINGEMFDLHLGDMISFDGNHYEYCSHKFTIETNRSKELFIKHLSEEEYRYRRQLHDKAAIAAMQGMLSNPWWMEQINKECVESRKTHKSEDFSDVLSEYADMYADNLVKHLLK